MNCDEIPGKDIFHDISALWRDLRKAPLRVRAWFELAQAYEAENLQWQGGYTARQSLRLDQSLLPALQSLRLEGWRNDNIGPAALSRIDLPDAAQLAERFQSQVAKHPGDWLTWLYLARLYEMRKTDQYLALASQALEQAIAVEPISGESLHHMGVWRFKAGDAQGAVVALSGLLDVRPVRHGSMMYLGLALLRTGNVVAAEKAFGRASLSENFDFLHTLATTVYDQNYWQESIAILQKALDRQPQSIPLLLTLARIQSEVYNLPDSRKTLERLFALDPTNVNGRMLDAGMHGRMGDAKKYLAIMQETYDTVGDPLSRLASSIAMILLYQDDLAAEDVADRHRSLCAPITESLTERTVFTNTLEVDRPLRIGYVTGDLHRQHPVNVFMLPVLLHHDHTDFEFCVYHTGKMFDVYTHQAMNSSDRWLEAAELDDPALRDKIAADGIDILIDLAGHTSSHRLGVFAMRGAPVQTTFLGYPHSTGLSTMDWLIGDETVSPPEHANLFSEGLAYLSDSVFCWSPVDEYSLPPARRAGAPVVFGSFNNAMKLSPSTIALWSRVLQAVPDSKFLLKAPSLRDESVRERFAGLFQAHGVDPERVIMRGPTALAEMMQEYGDMDIALDTVPYNGGTTTMQALWMGVPVVALEGKNFVGRMGASFMRTLGRPEWVAADEDGYVAAAVRLAEDRNTLRKGRAKLREEMAGSKLCDIESYVRNFEALLRRMWRAHCEGDTSRVLRLG